MPVKQDAKLQDIGRGIFDIEIDAYGDIRTADGFDTPILVSLFSDARADGSEVPDQGRRRGWIGDEGTEDNTGSKLWLFEQSRLTRTVANRVEDAARECLRWLIADGHAVSIRRAELLIGQEAVRFVVEILTEIGAEKRSFILWEATSTNGEFDPVIPPPTIPPVPPVIPPPILLGVTQSIDFDGVAENMLSAASPLNVGTSYTAAGWVKLLSTPVNTVVLWEFSDPNGNMNRISMSFASTTGKWRVFSRGNTNLGTGNIDYHINNPLPQLGVWVHHAWSYDTVSGELHIYVNGTEITDLTAIITPQHTPMTDTARLASIGRIRNGGAGLFVNMRAHSIALWDGILAPEEIAAIAAEPDVDLRTGTPFPYGKASVLRHWYVFGINPTDAGIQEDYGNGGDIDLNVGATITAVDLVSDVPT
jgi:phage gp46-like protein